MPDEAKEDRSHSRLRQHLRSGSGQRGREADRRFATAVVIFLLAALAYPWYASWVQGRSAARELVHRAAEPARTGRAAAGGAESRAQARTASRAGLQQQRVNRVRIVGATRGGGSPMVIVELDGVELAEASPTICREAAQWLERPLDGVALRVQRGQAGRDAIRMGTIRC